MKNFTHYFTLPLKIILTNLKIVIRLACKPFTVHNLKSSNIYQLHFQAFLPCYPHKNVSSCSAIRYITYHFQHAMYLKIARLQNVTHLCAMKEELSYSQKREWAKTQYTKEDISIRDIALKVDADEAIVRSWIQEGKWVEIKRSALTSKAVQLDYFYNALEKVTSRQATDNLKDVELMVKYTAAIKNLESETGVSSIVQVAETFTTWLLRRDPELSRTVTAHFDAFVREHDITQAKEIM